MALTSSTSIPGTLWYRDKPGLPAHFTTASVCRSASPGQCPEHTSFKSCQSSLMLKWQHKNSKNTELGTFFFPSPLKTMSFKLYFYSSPWWLHKTQQGGDEKRCRSWTHPAAKHRSTDYYTLLRRSLGHLPKGLAFQCHSCESLNILFETLTSLWNTSIWKIGLSFPHVELGKGNRMDMLDVQGKYIMLVSTSGRF